MLFDPLEPNVIQKAVACMSTPNCGPGVNVALVVAIAISAVFAAGCVVQDVPGKWFRRGLVVVIVTWLMVLAAGLGHAAAWFEQ